MSDTESPLMRRVLLHASRLGMRLFRNQVGVYQLKDGRWLRSGLCVGSSDLIGWTPVVVTQEMVGKTVAVFTACETKAGRKQATDEQRQFIDTVTLSGGLAVVIRAEADVDTLISLQHVNRDLFRGGLK